MPRLVHSGSSLAGEGDRAADVIAVLVRHEDRIEIARDKPGHGESVVELAQREAAIDQHPAWPRTIACLDDGRVTGTAAAEAAEAHGREASAVREAPFDGRYFRSSASRLTMRLPASPFSGAPWPSSTETRLDDELSDFTLTR